MFSENGRWVPPSIVSCRQQNNTTLLKTKTKKKCNSYKSKVKISNELCRHLNCTFKESSTIIQSKVILGKESMTLRKHQQDLSMKNKNISQTTAKINKLLQFVVVSIGNEVLQADWVTVKYKATRNTSMTHT